MQKTRLGITVGMVGAAIYFIGYFNGYVAAILLAGYVLLFENNLWLRRTVVKAIALMVMFAFLSATINLIPNVVGLIGDTARIFDAEFSVLPLTRLVTVINDVLSIVEKILFLLLGMRALKMKTIVVPVIDRLVTTNME